VRRKIPLHRQYPNLHFIRSMQSSTLCNHSPHAIMNPMQL